MSDPKFQEKFEWLQREVRGTLDFMGEFDPALEFQLPPPLDDFDFIQRIVWSLLRGRDGIRMGGVLVKMRNRDDWPTEHQIRLSTAFSIYVANAAWGPDITAAIAYWSLLPPGQYGDRYLRKTRIYLEMNVLLAMVKMQARRRLDRDGENADLSDPWKMLMDETREFVNSDFLEDATFLVQRTKQEWELEQEPEEEDVSAAS